MKTAFANNNDKNDKSDDDNNNLSDYLGLGLGDPMASWVGSTISSPKFTMPASGGGTRTSSLAGCLACFGTAIGVGYWMLEGVNVIVLVAGATACTIAEGLPFGNDNLNIPVITAFVVDQMSKSVAR